MCEVLAVAWEHAEPFGTILPWARDLERLGVAGFGWGLAWLDEDASTVRGYRTTSSLADDPDGAAALEDIRSRRFIVHVRRPSKLSTIDEGDSQPFFDEGRGCAFCHNGLFARAEDFRDRYADRLRGRADSEVGFHYLLDLLDEGRRPADALPRALEELGGRGNLAYLGRDGTLVVMAGHPENDMWRFQLGSAVAAATALHSADESMFDMVFAEATDRRKLAPLEVAELSGPISEAAARAVS
jgi:predicted glutamine amidotransferase